MQDYPGPFEVCGVDPGVLCEEMIELFQTEGVIAEPAGALATAALRQVSIPPNSDGTDVVCVVSGGNQDISRYGEVAERALISEGRKHYFIVEFPQEPGALRRFLDEVLGPDDDITLFEYVKRTSKEFGPGPGRHRARRSRRPVPADGEPGALPGARDPNPAERGRLPVSGLTAWMRTFRTRGFDKPRQNVPRTLVSHPRAKRTTARPDRPLADLRVNGGGGRQNDARTTRSTP